MKVINLNRIVMLSAGLSIHSSLKLLERMFRVLFRGIDRKLKNGVWTKALTSEVAMSQVVDVKKLRIARTTYPDKRGNFNETFQHIRLGLDEFYRERNPIFHSPFIPELGPVQKFPEANFKRPIVEIYHNENTAVSRSADISPLWVAKTTYPAEKRDFNETFLHIRTEIDRLYKEQNPAFNNIVSPDILRTKRTQHDEQIDIPGKISLIEQDSLSRSKESNAKHSEVVAYTSRESGSVVAGMDAAMEVAIQDYLACAETQGIDQEQHRIVENVKKEEPGFSEASSTGQEGFIDNLQRVSPIPELVDETLADALKSRATDTKHPKKRKKRRKFHQPLRKAWHFKDRKEGLREQIPDPIKNRNISRENLGSPVNPFLSRAS